MRLAALPALVALAGCSVSYVAAPASSSPPATTATTADYNRDLGTNRAGAEAAAVVGKLLGPSGYWEITVRTVPAAVAGWDPAPAGAAARLRARGAVTGVTVIMATEAAGALRSFRTGGHGHEQAVVTGLGRRLLEFFPAAAQVQVLIYFGESDEHAAAVISRTSATYRVLDGL